MINIRPDSQGNPIFNERLEFVHRFRVSDLSEQKMHKIELFTCIGLVKLFTAWRHVCAIRNGIKFTSGVIEQ